MRRISNWKSDFNVKIIVDQIEQKLENKPTKRADQRKSGTDSWDRFVFIFIRYLYLDIMVIQQYNIVLARAGNLWINMKRR